MTDAPPALVDTLVQDCIDREDETDFLYRDASKDGWVTSLIGRKFNSAFEVVSMLLPNGERAMRMGDRPATVAEISLDFVRVHAMPIGFKAEHYAVPKGPRFAPGFAVDTCRTELLGEYLPGIQRLVPDALALPVPVVRALVTMAYTMGIHGLAGFPHMLDSITMRDYASAALECHIKGATDATNERLRLWFVEASQPPTG